VRWAAGPAAAAALWLGACGDDAQERAARLFPAGPPIAHLEEFPFNADSLLPGGGAGPEEPPTVRKIGALAVDSSSDPGYLAYDFIGEAAARYTADEAEVRVTIAQFAEPIAAYGWYAAHRPNGAATDTIGRQSFWTGTRLYVYKGSYAIVAEAGDTSAAARAAAERLAREAANRATGEMRLSPYHILFPMHDRVAASDRYVGYGFLGAPRLNDVYTMDFVAGIDTARWFLTTDTSGLKLVVLRDWAEDGTRRLTVPAVLPFEPESAVYVEHPRYGRIIAGMAAQKLVGVVGYRPERQEQKLRSWLEGLRK